MGNRLWLIVAREHSIDWQNDQLAFFANHFEVLETYHFAGIEVRLFDLTAQE